MLQKLTLRITSEQQDQRLDQVLAGWLPRALSQPSLSKATVRKLIVAGAVYLNGKRVRIASKPLRVGARVDVYVDLKKLLASAPERGKPFSLTPERILYEDEWLIAVDKPPGLPTQPTLDEARENLFGAVKRFLAARAASKPRAPAPYLGLHHRLDRDTSGVILFTKDPAANAGVAELFSKHLAEKTYQAIAAWGGKAPPVEWTVKNYLGPLSKRGKQSRFGAVRSGGDFAHTDFRLLAELDEALWIEARPRTGRTHQIRVHLAEAGMPIFGDALYGPRGDAPREARAEVPRLMLHAVRLEFPHPGRPGERVRIESPIPQDFREALARLGAR